MPDYHTRCFATVAAYTNKRTNMPQRVGSVFLSYARSDRDLVKKIGQELSQTGLEVWDPDQKILPGADWTTELKAALDSAQCSRGVHFS
jgi:hypothetical protein